MAGPETSVFAASDLSGAVPDCTQLVVLLSRATKAGLLERVCRGIYTYPEAGASPGRLLYHAAARLRAGEFNYLSLESVLIEQKFEVRQQDPSAFRHMTEARLENLRTGSGLREALIDEMRRFLPANVVGQTVENPDYWTFLVQTIAEHCRRVTPSP